MRVETCRECGGSGVVTNPEFTSVWNAAVYRCGRTPTQEGLLDAAHELGFERVPPEEIDCPACGGEGVIEEWVDFWVALEAVISGSADDTNGDCAQMSADQTTGGLCCPDCGRHIGEGATMWLVTARRRYTLFGLIHILGYRRITRLYSDYITAVFVAGYFSCVGYVVDIKRWRGEENDA